MASVYPPDGYTITGAGGGVWGTDIDQETSTVHTGDYSIKFISTAKTNVYLISDAQPIIPGRFYRTMCDVYADDNTKNLSILTNQYDSGGSLITSVGGLRTVPVANTWYGLGDAFFASSTTRSAAIQFGRSSASFNLYVDSAVIRPIPGYFRAQANSTHSIANNTLTTVIFDTSSATLDPGTLVNTSTGVFTAPYSSVWTFTTALRWATSGSTTAEMRIELLVNGATVTGRANDTFGTTAFQRTHQFVSAPIALAAGDTVEVQGLQTTGGNLNVGGSTTCFFSGIEVGTSG